MEITLFKKNLNKAEERFFDKYLQQKTDAIESLLTTSAPDAKLLKVSIEKFEKHDAFQVEFYLTMPVKSIIAKEASHSINKAIDQAKDRLVAQIKKYKGHLRGGNSRQHTSIRRVEEKEMTVKDFEKEFI